MFGVEAERHVLQMSHSTSASANVHELAIKAANHRSIGR